MSGFQKTKEIGVRKVLGARLHHLGSVLLLSTIRQIILAVLIGIPVAWYLTQQYMERFSERIALQWWHYAVPEVLLLFIMFATIASILIKAARTNLWSLCDMSKGYVYHLTICVLFGQKRQNKSG